jgi:ABC-type multidrug transport system ATPase subunit
MQQNPFVIVESISKKYGDFIAVDKLSFSVNQGDIYGFLGPNGSGKSTTLRMLLSLIAPTEGSITVFGKSLARERNLILSRIGCIIEKPDFYRYLTARKNLELFGKLSGIKPANKDIDAMLDFVGLAGRENHEVKTYSHGMKQRLGLAQALLHNPDLIILDEPNTGLDPVGIIELRNMLLHLNKEQGKTIILSSHVLSEIEMIATRMIIINKGKKSAEGNVKELLDSEDLIVTFSFLSNENIITIARNSQWFNKALKISNDELTIQLALTDVAAFNAYLVEHNVAITSIQSKRKLEDYFMKLVNAAN